jgi:hypothetical protein
LPFGSPQKSPWSDIFKPTTFENPAKQKNLPPHLKWTPNQKPSNPVGEKRSVNTPFQPPTIQPGWVGSEGKGGELPLLYTKP